MASLRLVDLTTHTAGLSTLTRLLTVRVCKLRPAEIPSIFAGEEALTRSPYPAEIEIGA
jgi:hypothetical protein